MSDARAVWPGDDEPPQLASRVAGVGCWIGIALAVVAVVAYGLSSGAIRVGRTARTVPGLAEVQSMLRERYDAPRLELTVRNEDGGSLLEIDVVDAPFLARLGIESSEAEDEALTIAIVAYHALPEGLRFDHYEVVLTRRFGGNLAVERHRKFRLPESVLPPRHPR